RGSRWTWERAKLTSAFEVGQVRRLGEWALLASLAATGCGSWQRVGTGPRPQPGSALPSLADAGSLYRRLGFLVAGPPLPFVAAVRYVADATPDSTLAVFALSLANHALSFQRDGNTFVAQCHVEAAPRADSGLPGAGAQPRRRLAEAAGQPTGHLAVRRGHVALLHRGVRAALGRPTRRAGLRPERRRGGPRHGRAGGRRPLRLHAVRLS